MHLLAIKLITSGAALLAISTIQAPAFCQQLVAAKNNLPPCNMDSFVYQAGAQANMIYGDEGTTSYPPLFGFTQASRINAGITGINDAGLTTGHGSYMPDGTGADEFLAPPGEWNLSGTNHGNSMYNGAAAGLDARDASDAVTSAADQAANAAASNAMMSTMVNNTNNLLSNGDNGSNGYSESYSETYSDDSSDF